MKQINKNVSIGALIRAKRGTEPGVHKLLANYHTGGYKLRPISGWKRRNRIAAFRLWTHSLNPLERDDERPRQVNSNYQVRFYFDAHW